MLRNPRRENWPDPRCQSEAKLPEVFFFVFIFKNKFQFSINQSAFSTGLIHNQRRLSALCTIRGKSTFQRFTSPPPLLSWRVDLVQCCCVTVRQLQQSRTNQRNWASRVPSPESLKVKRSSSSVCVFSRLFFLFFFLFSTAL